MAILVAATTIAAVLTVVFECLPIHAFWDDLAGTFGGRCINVSAFIVDIGIVNAATDFILLMTVSGNSALVRKGDTVIVQADQVSLAHASDLAAKDAETAENGIDRHIPTWPLVSLSHGKFVLEVDR